MLALGALFQIVVDLVVGVRLLVRAARNRTLPELSFGLALVLFGGLGLPLAVIARRELLESAAANHLLLTGALALESAGSAALFVATWRIFRPDTRWAAWLAALSTGALALSAPFGGNDAGVLYWSGVLVRGLAFGWSSYESVRYARMLDRRAALGLADPIVTNRIWLWATSSSCVVVGFIVFIGGRSLGLDPTIPAILAIHSAVGLASGVALWLAFLPPARYVSWVAARQLSRRAPQPG